MQGGAVISCHLYCLTTFYHFIAFTSPALVFPGRKDTILNREF